MEQCAESDSEQCRHMIVFEPCAPDMRREWLTLDDLAEKAQLSQIGSIDKSAHLQHLPSVFPGKTG